MHGLSGTPTNISARSDWRRRRKWNSTTAVSTASFASTCFRRLEAQFQESRGAIKEERVERRPKRNNTPPTTTAIQPPKTDSRRSEADARQRPVREIREQTQRKPPGTAPRTGQQGSRREHTPSAGAVVARQEAKHPCQQRNSAQPHMEGTQEKNTDNTDTQK